MLFSFLFLYLTLFSLPRNEFKPETSRLWLSSRSTQYIPQPSPVPTIPVRQLSFVSETILAVSLGLTLIFSDLTKLESGRSELEQQAFVLPILHAMSRTSLLIICVETTHNKTHNSVVTYKPTSIVSTVFPLPSLWRFSAVARLETSASSETSNGPGW